LRVILCVPNSYPRGHPFWAYFFGNSGSSKRSAFLCRFLTRLGVSLPEDTPGRYASAYSELTFAAWRSESHDRDAGIWECNANASEAFSFARAERRGAAEKFRSRQKSRGKRPVSTRGADSSGPLRAVRTIPEGARRAAGAGWSPRTSLDALVRSAEALRSICAALDLMADERGRPARVFGGTTRPRPARRVRSRLPSASATA
jgi:hypothetical protein